MPPIHLTIKDLEALQARGISTDLAEEQLHLLQKGPPFQSLDRPCTLGDGIRCLSDTEISKGIDRYDRLAPHREIIKFVPASGAATRMFMDLITVEKSDAFVEPDWIKKRAASGEAAYQTLITFMDNLPHFAFYEALTALSTHEEITMARLQKRKHYLRVLRYLLNPVGLNYSRLPKGLILFHHYPEGPRTAFEEHLAEAALYAKGKGGTAKLHFTVSPDHLPRFEALLNHVKRQYESQFTTPLKVNFSIQKRHTDTLATNREGAPFRNPDGSLLFRPGGHGALIENLNRLKGDIVFIKNIDNVVHDRFKPTTTRYKKALAGLLMALQDDTFTWLQGLCAPLSTPAMVDGAFAFARAHLHLIPPAGIHQSSTATRRQWIIDHLNRPLRVCGVVKNDGAPGGGPFWIEESDHRLSLQIVENSAVAPSAQQQDLLRAATHFNPVDLVCGIRDFTGAPFDLSRFVDPEAVFVSQKSKGGHQLNALELPGLWNGGMAHWNTIFVEVPPETFNPVKLVNDLLQERHGAPMNLPPLFSGPQKYHRRQEGGPP